MLQESKFIISVYAEKQLKHQIVCCSIVFNVIPNKIIYKSNLEESRDLNTRVYLSFQQKLGKQFVSLKAFRVIHLNGRKLPSNSDCK